MPEILDGWPGGSPGQPGYSQKYDWDTILDGQVRKYTPAELEDLGANSLEAFANTARAAARTRQLRARVLRLPDGNVVIQAYSRAAVTGE
jgi:hypothetical protein